MGDPVRYFSYTAQVPPSSLIFDIKKVNTTAMGLTVRAGGAQFHGPSVRKRNGGGGAVG